MEKTDILVLHGTDPSAMAKRLVAEAGLAAQIGDTRKRIGLKPNLVAPTPAQNGATTHPEVVAGLIEYLQENGFNNIAILEGAWVGAKTTDAFRACGYFRLSDRYGVELIDLQKDNAHTQDCAGVAIKICDSALAVDFMINLPVLKGHCQTLLTCALKNNKGIIPNAEKRRFHTMGLHRPIAHLNTVAKNDFILVDGICGDLDFEEGGNPVQNNMLFAARDPVLCDAFAAQLIGIPQQDIPYIALAEKLGVGSAGLSAATIRQLNEGNAAGAAPAPTGKSQRLAAYIHEDSACSACYASLLRALNRMDGRALKRLSGKICVGQGFAGKTGPLGVGRCTAGFANTVGGCPPTANDILALLQSQPDGGPPRK